VLAVLALGIGCRGPDTPKVDATYDKATGKLTRLQADLNGDGRTDTWTYMDGAVPTRTEQDLNGDGKIERWEYPRPDGTNAEVALSRRNTGQPDMWTYLDPGGEPTRIEFASTDAPTPEQKARIDRTELYTAGRLARVEEDTDGDGRVDKWEQHDGPDVRSVEFDHDRDGKPDERITFGAGGKVIDRQKIGTQTGSGK
jgi:hypothetical protein